MNPNGIFDDIANSSRRANEVINKEVLNLPEWLKNEAVVLYGYLLSPWTIPIKIEYGHLSNGKLLTAFKVNDIRFFEISKAISYAMALKLIEYITDKLP